MSMPTLGAADPVHVGTDVGFIGLGHMGEPMAANLLRDRGRLVVWNRSEPAARRMASIGARVAATPAEVLDSCDTVVLMLADLAAIDEVLGRTDQRITTAVGGRTIVNMGTIAPADSAQLGMALRAHGATYVEAPVSGSRVPAENRALVAMLAGPPAVLDRVEQLLGSMCAAVFRCGEVPRALTTKLAVNTFLIDLVTGLAEATRFAEANDVDLDVFRAVLDSGPMASDVSRLKIGKLLTGDHAPQASVRDVRYNCRLILDQARGTDTVLPLLAECEKLLGTAQHLGAGGQDMIAVIHALRQRGEAAAPPIEVGSEPPP
jgi:3-hydroxyisobutyrate dehydrogenase